MSLDNATRIDRRQFVAGLVQGTPNALIVTGLGSSTYDVFAAGDRDGNFYLWGAMGGAVPTGLGLALARPERPVVVVTGDGELMMGVGSLATVAVQSPPNLTIVALDNGVFGETGMQRSHSGLGTDLSAVAAAMGIENSVRITSPDQLPGLIDAINQRHRTTFCQVLVHADEPARALPPRDGAYVTTRFRAALGYKPF